MWPLRGSRPGGVNSVPSERRIRNQNRQKSEGLTKTHLFQRKPQVKAAHTCTAEIVCARSGKEPQVVGVIIVVLFQSTSRGYQQQTHEERAPDGCARLPRGRDGHFLFAGMPRARASSCFVLPVFSCFIPVLPLWYCCPIIRIKLSKTAIISSSSLVSPGSGIGCGGVHRGGVAVQGLRGSGLCAASKLRSIE